MGAWGTGIFDDDVASDVRDVWEEAIASGLPPAEASERVLNEFRELVEDEDDGPVVFIALAAIQHDAGALEDRVREMALISIPASVERWEDEATPEDATERAKELEELRRRLDTAAA